MSKSKTSASGNGAILQEIYALLAPFNKNNIELNESHDLNADLDVDSVAALDLLMNIEDKFDISISINHLSEIHTVGDLATVVSGIMQKKKGRSRAVDIFDKFDLHARVIDDLLDGDSQRLSPLGIQIDEVRSATDAMIDGKPVILAGTNNYLGLTFDPRCIAAACAATEAHGTGTTGSRVANGTYSGHLALEQEIAAYLDRRAAIVFSTGYQANLAVLSGLGGPSDFIFIDADSHASIYDSCKLSAATIIRFKHNDPADLDKRLARLDPEHTNKLVVVEGIYSMIGDRAPLAELVEVKRRHNAYMVLDEAHSLGVLGRNGRGLAEETEVEDDVDFVVGTFSKSLGAVGGFCASNHPKFEMLRVAARPYVYTASLPPSIIASVHAAVRLIRAEPELRTRLWRNVGALYNSLVDMGFTLCSEMSPIIAIEVPTPKDAMRLWSELLANGVYVNLMVPPATPGNLSLLRCSVSAAHTEVQIEAICKAFESVAKSMGVAPALAPVGDKDQAPAP